VLFGADLSRSRTVGIALHWVFGFIEMTLEEVAKS
jgi:hypothetical protein